MFSAICVGGPGTMSRVAMPRRAVMKKRLKPSNAPTPLAVMVCASLLERYCAALCGISSLSSSNTESTMPYSVSPVEAGVLAVAAVWAGTVAA